MSRGTWVHMGLHPSTPTHPQPYPILTLLKETAMVSKAFSNSCLSDSLLHS